MMTKIYNIKLLWWERQRVAGAYKHFRKYKSHYSGDGRLFKIFNDRRRHFYETWPIYRACSYTLNNPRSFDAVYFKDMAKAFDAGEQI